MQHATHHQYNGKHKHNAYVKGHAIGQYYPFIFFFLFGSGDHLSNRGLVARRFRHHSRLGRMVRVRHWWPDPSAQRIMWIPRHTVDRIQLRRDQRRGP